MNKPIVLAAALALVIAGTASTQAYAQYLGNEGATGITTEAQLAECEELGISTANCNDNTILAARKVVIAGANPSTGSGTSMLSTESGTMIAFIGILGAIFGGVAAAFFIKGRGAKPASS